LWIQPANTTSSYLRKAVTVENARIKAGDTSFSLWVTISIGVTTTVAKFEQNNSKLVDAADACLYDSKKVGRNRVSVCVID